MSEIRKAARVEAGHLRRSVRASLPYAAGGIVRGPMVSFNGMGAVAAAEQMSALFGGCAHADRHEVRLSSNELVAWICKGCNRQLVNEKWVASGP